MNYNNLSNDRIHWIDIAKFWGIVLIVLNHAAAGYLFNYTVSYNSIIFFFLAGLTFCCKKEACALPNSDEKADSFSAFNFMFDNRSPKEFFTKLVKSVLVPYLIWGTISVSIYFLLGKYFQMTGSARYAENDYSFIKNILGMLYGNSNTGYFEWNKPLWFITCLVSIEIIWYLILKLISSKNTSALVFAAFMIFSVIWMFISRNKGLTLPFELESALGLMFFFGLGLLVRTKMNELNNLTENIRKASYTAIVSLIGLVSFAATLYLVKLNDLTAARIEQYENLGIYIANAVLGIIFIVSISLLIKKSSIMEYIGKRTMAILVMHKFPIMFITIFLPQIRTMIDNLNTFVSIIVTAVTILLCLGVEKIISMFLPEVFGRSKPNP